MPWKIPSHSAAVSLVNIHGAQSARRNQNQELQSIAKMPGLSDTDLECRLNEKVNLPTFSVHTTDSRSTVNWTVDPLLTYCCFQRAKVHMILLLLGYLPWLSVASSCLGKVLWSTSSHRWQYLPCSLSLALPRLRPTWSWRFGQRKSVRIDNGRERIRGTSPCFWTQYTRPCLGANSNPNPNSPNPGGWVHTRPESALGLINPGFWSQIYLPLPWR